MQTTTVPVVLMFRVEDLTNIEESERARLIALFDKLGLPHVIAESHFVISSDMQHDNAMIQKLFDVLSWCISRQLLLLSQRCTSAQMGARPSLNVPPTFIGNQVNLLRAVCGLGVHWSFFESCHGKCYCDLEGGTLKNAVRQYELNVTNRVVCVAVCPHGAPHATNAPTVGQISAK